MTIMKKGIAVLALSVAVGALGGCVQIERGFIAKPPLRIAAQDVAVYVHKSAVPAGYTHVDDRSTDYEDFQRDKLLARLGTATGVRGANAIILDRYFPPVKGSRDFGDLLQSYSMKENRGDGELHRHAATTAGRPAPLGKIQLAGSSRCSVAAFISAAWSFSKARTSIWRIRSRLTP